MDDVQKCASKNAMATVARSFAPVRIERQLLARAFDLVCDVDPRTPQPTPGRDDHAMAGRRLAVNAERRRAA